MEFRVLGPFEFVGAAGTVEPGPGADKGQVGGGRTRWRPRTSLPTVLIHGAGAV